MDLKENDFNIAKLGVTTLKPDREGHHSALVVAVRLDAIEPA